jgi:hypothetical protein
MERSEASTGHQSGFPDTFVRNEAHASGVSWAAVIAGAFVAAALSLILLALGAGMGLSSVSPWSNVGASGSTISRAALIWLIIIQIIASAMGGYLAGRLRIKWATIHTDEVYFRDTAHGFLVWAVGLVITVSFLASAAASMVNGAAQRANIAGSPGTAVGQRTDAPNVDSNVRVETAGIYTYALARGNLSAADRTYLGKLVAAKTGLTQTEAEQRAADVFVEIQRAAETARKAAAHLCLWLFVALLIGAFCASYAATIGGRERDHIKLV